MSHKDVKNSGLTDKQIKVVMINGFLGDTKILALAKKISLDFNFDSSMDELILTTSEQHRIIKFGCALEDFAYKFMVGDGEPWETIETFLSDPKEHLKELFLCGSDAFKSLIKAALKNKENFTNHYLTTKKEVIEGLYNTPDKQQDEIKLAEKPFKVFAEPCFNYEWE